MAITNVQTQVDVSAASSTSVSATLASGATAGNMIWCFVGFDKAAGTITPPTGFTTIMSNSSTSVSMWVGCKVAAGGETTITATRSTTTPSGDRMWIGEFADSGSERWAIWSSAMHPTDESTVTSWSSGTAADPGQACASIAFFAIDSAGSSTGAETWTNSYAELQEWTTGSQAGVAVGWLSSVSAGSTQETTHGHTGTADQVSGAIVTFGRASGPISFTDSVAVSDDQSTASYQQPRHGVKVEVEFTVGVWTDVSDYIQAEVETTGTFGRPTRFDDVAASTWTVTLRNGDGRFTPMNPFSPYYPNVAKGRRMRVYATWAGQTYPRFWGFITGITLPALTGVDDATVTINATDIMGTLERKTLQSPFVEESLRQARQNAGGVDVFPFPPSSVKTQTSVQVADTSFENKGLLFPGSSRLGTVTVMPVGNDAGVVKSSGAGGTDGVLSEGTLEFEVGDNGQGKQAHPILVCKPQVGFQQFEFFFSIPENVLPPLIWPAGGPTHTIVSGNNWNTVPALYSMTQQELAMLNPEQYPDAMVIGNVLKVANDSVRLDSEWILAQLWSGSTEVLRIIVINTKGKVALAARKPGGGVAMVFGNPEGTEVTLADGKWRKFTMYKDADNSVRMNVNDSAAGSSVTSLAADLTAVDTVYIGGRANPTTGPGLQVQCPPCSISAVAFQKTRNGVWYWYCLGAPPANISARDRFAELAQYAKPIPLQSGYAWNASLDAPLDVKVVRTDITGRTLLDCMQEVARTVGGYLWVQPEDGYLMIRKGPTPPLNLAPIDMIGDVDIDNPPQWRDTVDAQPTRVTAKCPAGEATSINTAAEAAGQYRDATVETCAPTTAVAKGVADRMIGGSSTLHLTNLSVDLVHAGTSLWGSLLPVFLPTERALYITGVPAAIFGYEAISGTVESWTESYSIDSARFTFETTPAPAAAVVPPLAGFTVTSSVGAQSNGTVAVPRPAGTASGDVLAAVMTVDNTGTLAAMAPPDATWTEQGSGGSGNSGYGRIWTKVAGTSEPASYTFTANGTEGSSAVLMTSDFAGTAGAWDSTKWTALEVRTGATLTKDGAGVGVMNPGTNTGYTGRVSAKAAIADKADVDLVFSFRFLDNDSFGWTVLRGDSGGLTQNGYEFRPQVGSSGFKVSKLVSYASTTLGTYAITMTAGTWYRMRCQTTGSTVRARVWPVGTAEPGSWHISVTDTTYTAAGPVVIAAGGGNLATSRFHIDDATVSDVNAVSGWPEAKVTLLRVAGADTTSPVLVAPSWSADNAATTSHAAPSLTPAEPGLLINHYHVLTAGSGTGGGGGGGAAAFSFGMSGFDNMSQVAAANTWLAGHSLKALGIWADSSATIQQDAYGTGSGEKYETWNGILDHAFGGVFGAETWAQAASGTFDSRWTTGITNLKNKWGSRPAGNMHIRFAHEFNGSFSDWAVTDSGDMSYTNFKNAWIRWANLVRSIFPGAQIVWSPNDGTSSLTTVDNAYPGSAYVDVIGPDSYNAWPHVNDLASWTSKINGTSGGNPVGIEAWRQYAEGKGKPFALPEFGNPAVDVGGGAGGGDAPYWGQAIIAWCKEHGGYGAGQVKYGVYFNHGTAAGYSADYLIWASGTNGTVHQPLCAEAIRSTA